MEAAFEGIDVQTAREMHDAVLPQIGVRERYTYAVYALALCTIALRRRAPAIAAAAPASAGTSPTVAARVGGISRPCPMPSMASGSTNSAISAPSRHKEPQ